MTTSGDYRAFLLGKQLIDEPSGFEPHALNPALFDFQHDIVDWALRRGRAAIFADCGLGKTPMQLEWAWRVHEETGGTVLILAPLAVSAQTIREGQKFGIPVRACRDSGDIRPGVNVTNYERLERFMRGQFVGLVLDESSILKGFDGKTRRLVTEFGRSIPYRLACTATPAPNDLVEVVNHAEFLGIMERKEIEALFFTQGETTAQRRLKGHARRDFWRWLASWAVALRRPSDLGHADDRFELPPLRFHHMIVSGEVVSGHLFPVEAQTLMERRQARRDSLSERVQRAVDLVAAEPDEAWVLWCDLNSESEALARAIPGAVEIRGSNTAEHKEQALLDFSEGRARVLVTKPTIAGFGLNWQHCARMCFVGLSDSYEQLYQATRRCWRFGQERPVEAYIVAAETEGAVVRNIERKERQAAEMMGQIVAHMSGLSLGRAGRETMDYEREKRTGERWTLHLGDSVEVLPELAESSIGLAVFSPPFPGMYAYTNSPRDMGNVASNEEMIEQFRYLVPEILRVLIPGRTCAVHLCQGMAHKKDGNEPGLRDFRGQVIRVMEEEGFTYYGEVAIDKDPQIKAIRTKDRGLLFKTLAKDSAHMRMALADYILQFRKPGENPNPITAGISERYGNREGWITPEEWIEWAAPVWYRAGEGYPGGIRETDVLNVAMARETDDERHLAPLQLGVIERCVKLWSAPGETVLSPFAGIGSEGVVSLQLGRRFVGVELKRSYFEAAARNLVAAEGQLSLLADRPA